MEATGNPGLSPEVQMALDRRGGTPTPQLAQTSPQAPMQGQVPQPMNPSEIGQTSGPVTPNAPSQKYQPQNQEDLIIMALIEQLKTGGKLKKEVLAMEKTPTAPTPAPQPQTPPPSPDFSMGSPMAVSNQQSQYPF